MPASLRILMVVGALLIFLFIARRIRQHKILMADATYWVVLALLLTLAALLPDVLIRLAFALGFQSPANFVFLCIIGLLLMKTFGNSAEISMLRHKVEELTQEEALGWGPREDASRGPHDDVRAHAREVVSRNPREEVR